MAVKKHVHCYDVWPHGQVRACLMAELELDGDLMYNGVRYKPVLGFDSRDRLEIARDFVRAFVVTPVDGVGSPSEAKGRELVGAGTGPADATH